MTGQVLGSPNFMPPEQAGLKLGKAGRYSDVYSLGAILFYLVTGRPPHLAESASGTLHHVLNSEVISPRLLNPQVPVDLATICLKCLEKDATRRYSTARTLAEELDRFLRGEPILARPIGRVATAWRWCQRKPLVASLITATALLFLAVSIGSPVAYLLIKQEQKTTRENLYAADMAVVQQAVEQGDLGQARQFLGAHAPRRREPDLRGFEWRHLWLRGRGDELLTLQERGEPVFHLSFSRDGRWLEGGGKVWETPLARPGDGTPPRSRYQLPTGHMALGFTPARELLIKNDRQELKRWDPITGRETLLLAGEEVHAVAFSNSGRWLATGGAKTLTLWDTTTWRPLATNATVQFTRDLWKTLAFSPDERWLITSTGGAFSHKSVVEYWSLPGLLPLAPPDARVKDILSVVFSPAGDDYHTGSADGTLRAWDVQTRAEIEARRVPKLHRAWISQVAPLPNSRKLVTTSADRTIRISDQDGQNSLLLRGHLDEIWSLAVSPDGQTIVTGDRSGAIKVWSTQSALGNGAMESLADPGDRMQSLGLSPDGQVLATLTASALKFWNLRARPVEEIRSLRWESAAGGLPLDPTVGDGFVSLTPDFEHFAVARRDQPLEVWNLRNSKKHLLAHSGPVAFPLFSPDGKWLVSATASNAATVWNTAALDQPRVIAAPHSLQRDSVPFAFSRDAGTLAISLEEHILLWDARKHQRLGLHPVPPRLVTALSPDGRLLAAGFKENLVHIYEARTGRLLGKPLEGHLSGVQALAFSPDSSTLYSGADESRLWHLATRRCMIIHHQPSASVSAIFSADARVLVVGEIGQRIQIWRAPSLAEIEEWAEGKPGSGLRP
jgi:WD40 repeat protein